MNYKLRLLGLAGTGFLLLGCNRGTGSGRSHAVADPLSNLDSTITAVGVLTDKITRKGESVSLSQDLSVDSANSAASVHLRYYWTRVGGRNVHDFQVASIASFRGRFFDPSDLQEWGRIWVNWIPRSHEEALNVCLEIIAVGVTNTPNRLHDRDLLQAATADRFVSPADKDRFRRVDLAAVSERDPGAEGQWRVQFWYPDLHRPGRPGRLATRYHCLIPGTLTRQGFHVVEADSVVDR